MSVIHKSPPLLGLRFAVSDGSARYNTLKSIEYSRQGRAITASASHSRRPASGSPVPVINTLLSGHVVGLRAGHPHHGGVQLVEVGQDVLPEALSVAAVVS